MRPACRSRPARSARWSGPCATRAKGCARPTSSTSAPCSRSRGRTSARWSAPTPTGLRCRAAASCSARTSSPMRPGSCRTSARASGVHDARTRMKKYCLLAALCLSMAAASAQDAAVRPITHEDVWLMKRVGEPALSPDGRLVVVQVSEPAYDEKDKSSDLWLVPADGSAPPRQITHSASAESGVAWSADSRRIAFSAKREDQEESQVFVLDIAGGGEAQPVTDTVTGASKPLWRPDGGALLFTSMTYPGATTDAENKARIAEMKARKYNARVFESFPIRHWDRWLDERRPTLMLQELDGESLARDLLAGTTLRNAPGFGGRSEEHT